MSAFIVSTDCIHRCLYAALRHDGGGQPFLLPDGDTDLDGLGARLLLLNREAVRQRYPDQWALTEDLARAYRWRLPALRSPAALLKALASLQYQCAEGTVPEDPLYRALSAFVRRLRSVWGDEPPGWGEAPWG